MQSRHLIRSITRGLTILQMANRSESMSVTEIALAADMPYGTAFRIVQTLVHSGMLEREPGRKRYRVTALVHTLSHGFQTRSRLVIAARPHIVALTERFGWPITVTTRVGSSMIIGDSTHSLTSLTFNLYHPGYAFPILEASSGRVYLAFCEDNERRSVLMGLRQDQTIVGRELISLYESEAMLSQIRSAGYATKGRNKYTEHPGKTSSIAAPIFDQGALAGAISLTFFASAISMDEAVAQFADGLKETARAISDAMARPEPNPERIQADDFAHSE